MHRFHFIRMDWTECKHFWYWWCVWLFLPYSVSCALKNLINNLCLVYTAWPLYRSAPDAAAGAGEGEGGPGGPPPNVTSNRRLQQTQAQVDEVSEFGLVVMVLSTLYSKVVNLGVSNCALAHFGHYVLVHLKHNNALKSPGLSFQMLKIYNMKRK